MTHKQKRKGEKIKKKELIPLTHSLSHLESVSRICTFLSFRVFQVLCRVFTIRKKERTTCQACETHSSSALEWPLVS